MKTCNHNPRRLYCGWSMSPVTWERELFVMCCDCGKMLKGGER